MYIINYQTWNFSHFHVWIFLPCYHCKRKFYECMRCSFVLPSQCAKNFKDVVTCAVIVGCNNYQNSNVYAMQIMKIELKMELFPSTETSTNAEYPTSFKNCGSNVYIWERFCIFCKKCRKAWNILVTAIGVWILGL